MAILGKWNDDMRAITEDEALSAEEVTAISRRLTLIRTHAVGENQADMARLLGIKPSRWNNLERGWPLTLRLAFLICKNVEGITIGYIAEGHTADLPLGLRRRLEELEADLFPRRTKRSLKR